MQDKPADILDSNIEEHTFIRRRNILPWWIKIFIWIFFVFGVIAPFGLVFALIGIPFQLTIYGINSSDPFSIFGLALLGIFLIKGITSFGLWMEKDWAIEVGQADAILGILVCTFETIVSPFFDSQPGFNFNIRLELLLLIPFFIRLSKIKSEWRKLAMSS